MKVPKAMQEIYDGMAKPISDYCEKHLDKEYEALCLHALEKLCRKRPSPLLHGRAGTWIAGIIYAVTSTNFIFDKSQPIHMTADELVEPLGVSASTASNKAREIKKLLKMDYFNAEWCLASHVENNPGIWLVMVDGMLFDARTLPLHLQIQCYEKGIIPYVPALGKPKD